MYIKLTKKDDEDYSRVNNGRVFGKHPYVKHWLMSYNYGVRAKVRIKLGLRLCMSN